jgi:apolipoprotein N-acyltransferase
MVKWKNNLAKLVAVLISGFLLACAFPLPEFLKTMEGASAAWLGLIPLIIVVRLSRPKAAFWWGWLGGFVFWLITLIWLLRLRNSWGVLPVVVLSWIGLAAYCAIYTGLFGFLLAKIFPVSDMEQGGSYEGADSRKGIKFVHRIVPLVMAPVIWIGTEYLRAVIGTGFPWNCLGVCQYQNIPAIQIASWGGIYAVSGLIVLLNAALAMTAIRVITEVRYRKKRGRIHYELMLGLVAVAVCWSFGVRRVKLGDAVRGVSQVQSIRVASIQPNIAQPKKWYPGFRDESYTALEKQSDLALMSKPDLLVWPETAIPDILTVDPTAQKVVGRIVSPKTSILVGSLDFEQREDRLDYYNASFLVDGTGHIAGTYRKRHLVPFGEYLPFENQVPLIKRMAPLGFSCLPGDDNQVLELKTPASGSSRFGILICFEDVFPYLARRDVRTGARFLVNQTNDGWFQGSSASRQHMANSIFRAVENRVPMVRCANTGVTCSIDRFGRIFEMLSDDKGNTELCGFSVSELNLEPANRKLTLYSRFGDWLLAVPCMLAVIGLLLYGLLPKLKKFRHIKMRLLTEAASQKAPRD